MVKNLDLITALRTTELHLPFTVPLEIKQKDNNIEHTTLECLEILRHLPGRRVVCRATYQDRQVLAKLFIHKGKARRDYQQELDGYQLLAQNEHKENTTEEIVTPQLVAHGTFSTGGFFVLFQYIDDCVQLQGTLPPTLNATAKQAIDSLMQSVATMHNLKVQQIDLHLNNFLQKANKLYTIDCGDISQLKHNKKKQLRQIHKNIADLLSQLPISYNSSLEEFIKTYQQASNNASQLSTAKIKQHMTKWRKWRLKNYLKKSSRTCTEFIAEKSWHQFRVYRREYSNSEWLECYANVDQLAEESLRLKDGNSATVAQTTCDGINIVIKRYNIKNFKHLLSRFWRPSRAWRTWQNAQRLNVLGIATPQPIAIIERRWGYFRSQAYYISIHEPAPDTLTIYDPSKHTTNRQQLMATQHLRNFQQLFRTMQYAKISHGDMKGNNFLLSENNLSVIDLDAMRFHHCQYGFNRAFAKDMDRFLRNWSPDSPIQQQVRQMIDNMKQQN